MSAELSVSEKMACKYTVRPLLCCWICRNFLKLAHTQSLRFTHSNLICKLQLWQSLAPDWENFATHDKIGCYTFISRVDHNFFSIRQSKNILLTVTPFAVLSSPNWFYHTLSLFLILWRGLSLLGDEVIEGVLLALVAALFQLFKEGDSNLCLCRPTLRFLSSGLAILTKLIDSLLEDTIYEKKLFSKVLHILGPK